MKLYFVSTGFGNVLLGLFVQGGGSKRVPLPILCAVIEREEGLVLFDTGIGTRIEQEFKPLRNRGNWFFSRAVMHTEFDPARDALVSGSPALRFDPSEVTCAVLSHLHWDHAGGMRDFPHCRFIVNRPEWEDAVSRRGISAYISEQLGETEGLEVDLISTDPGRPYLSFPASRDVFDDGSLVLVDIPGHAFGQVGMVVNLPSGRRFFLGGDSYYFPDSLERMAPQIACHAGRGEGESEEAEETLEILSEDSPMMSRTSTACPATTTILPGRFELAPVGYD